MSVFSNKSEKLVLIWQSKKKKKEKEKMKNAAKSNKTNNTKQNTWKTIQRVTSKMSALTSQLTGPWRQDTDLRTGGWQSSSALPDSDLLILNMLRIIPFFLASLRAWFCMCVYLCVHVCIGKFFFMVECAGMCRMRVIVECFVSPLQCQGLYKCHSFSIV